jgi:hypothetical protein
MDDRSRKHSRYMAISGGRRDKKSSELRFQIKVGMKEMRNGPADLGRGDGKVSWEST